MKKILLAIAIILIACTPQVELPKKTETSLPLPPNIEKLQATMPATPVHPCALLEKEDGLQLCNLTIQRSEQTTDGCEQAFISPKLPYPHVSIKVASYETINAAKEKFEWNQKTTGAQNNAIKYELRQSYAFQRDGNTHIEFLKGKKIIRITEAPKDACQSLSMLAKKVYRKA